MLSDFGLSFLTRLSCRAEPNAEGSTPTDKCFDVSLSADSTGFSKVLSSGALIRLDFGFGGTWGLLSVVSGESL